MPPSVIHPEETYDAFRSLESFSSVARRFGVMRPTLRRWWIAKFGSTAFEQRIAKAKQTSEERKTKRKAYTEANNEHIREVKRAWRVANPEKVRQSKQSNPKVKKAYNRRYYAQNAEDLREAARQYRLENGDKLRLKEREYYKRYPERLLWKSAKQRARRFNLAFSITVKDILKVIPSDGRCPITQEPFEQGIGKVGPRSMTLDRIVPALGYTPGNIAVISHLANTLKHSCTDAGRFRRLADYLERLL